MTRIAALFDAIAPQYVVLAMLFAGILALCEGIRQAFSNDDASLGQAATRLQRLGQATATLRAPDAAPFWLKLPFFGNLPVKMRQAGLTVAPQRLLAICAGIAVPVFALFGWRLGVVPGACMAALIALGGPTAWINHMRAKRMMAFSKQLPDALEMMRRGLTVGHPLNVTIATVGREMADPVGEEFRLLADQIAYGDGLVDAVQDMATRIDHEDLHYLSAAVAIQQSAGGNLAAVLATLARVIRMRFSMRRRVKAISSEGRISAIILTALPFLMFGATLITAPTYFSGVSDDPKFLPLAIIVVVLVTGNGLMMKKLVTFRI